MLKWYFLKKNIAKIINDLDCDIIVLMNIPKLPLFRSYHRNRLIRAKGGICILIREEYASDSIHVWVGYDENEALADSIPSLDLIVIVSYGTQSNSFGAATTNDHMREIFGQINN